MEGFLRTIMKTGDLMKRKVYVHQIQAASWKNLLPLSAALLTSYARSIPEIRKKYDFEIKILRQDPSETVNSYESPDVLAFSAYSWNFRQSLEIARIGKIAAPKSLVVFGGPMIPNDPDALRGLFADYPFIDIVVHGMGEWAFADILLAWPEERDFGCIAGISYRKKGGRISTTLPVYGRNLDELPSPFLDGTFDELLSRYGDRITGALWETNRGCPYSCTFCVQGNPLFSKIVRFSKDRLYKELEWISDRKISYLFGTDANFGVLQRDYDIARKIAALGRQNGYPKYFFINWLKNSSRKMMDIAKTLCEGGVHTRLTLSTQSFNPDTLVAIKRKNIDSSTAEDLKRRAAKEGIDTYTELILGLPNETYDSLISNMNRCLDRYLTHFFVVYLCRLLDGTEMAGHEYRNKYKLETRSCHVGFARHEGFDIGVTEVEDIVVATNTLPVCDWEKAFTFVYTALVLHNFRLAFFIFAYLQTEFSISLSGLVEYIISRGMNADSSSTVSKALGVINNGRQSILAERTSLVSLDFTENMLLEVQEAALLVLLNDIESFYRELRSFVDDYLRLKGVNVPASVMTEVFEYQIARIPTWKDPGPGRVSFEYNVPQYFQALCVDDKPISIRKDKSYMELGNGTKERISRRLPTQEISQSQRFLVILKD